MSSPTQRSLKVLRDDGFTAQVVEKWNPYAKIRQDLFGFIDIVAVGGLGIVGVQTTTTVNMSARRKKIIESEAAQKWLAAGGKIEVHGWAKRGPRGKRKTWQVSVYHVTEQDFKDETVL